MSELRDYLQKINLIQHPNKAELTSDIKSKLEQAGYTVVDMDDAKPWGAYFRVDGAQAEQFIGEFFSGLTVDEARRGIDNAELSPKILLVAPSQRLSWQYHDRRAERWTFLTAGSYEGSLTDQESDPIVATADQVVQFATGERHRLIGTATSYTVVAEIWQHSDPAHPSDEADIIRLADDYKRQ